jgi:hypothetical protein
MINISYFDWNSKNLVRSAIEDYIRFNRYVANQSACTSHDGKAIADKIHHLEKLLDTFARCDEYEDAFSKEWDRTAEYRSNLVQDIISTKQILSRAELNIDPIVRECFVLALERDPKKIKQSEEDEAKYGHPLVDKAKQHLSLIPESKPNRPIWMADIMMPVELEEDELDLMIESVSFVFSPYDMFHWKSNIAQLHEYAAEWCASNLRGDGNDLALLAGELEGYISISTSKI